MERHQLKDEQWELIADLFPKPKPRPKSAGRPPSDPRKMVDGILWILNTGAPWRDLPKNYGPKSTVWDYFDHCNDNGTLLKVLDRLREYVTINQELWCIDGTIVRAAKCAAGGGKKTMPMNPPIMPWAAAVAV